LLIAVLPAERHNPWAAWLSHVAHRFMLVCVFLPECDYVTLVYSVTNPSVCLSVVCNVRAPYSANWNFRHCIYAILYLSHPL